MVCPKTKKLVIKRDKKFTQRFWEVNKKTGMKKQITHKKAKSKWGWKH